MYLGKERAYIRPERAQDYFVVLPSSISEYSGLGLYAKRDIPAGTVFPYPYPAYPYPGLSLSSFEQYDKMMGDLAVLADAYDGSLNMPIGNIDVRGDLKMLEELYGITIRAAERDPKTWTWHTLDDDNVMIDWDRVIHSINAYAFEVVSGTKALQYYWPHYSHKGDLIFDPNDLVNMAFMANEPPPYDFTNLVTSRPQTNSVNAITAERNGKLYYKSLTDIKRGDEILICYGPQYSRSGYRINMSSVNGCGHPVFQEKFPRPTRGRAPREIEQFYRDIREYRQDPKLQQTVVSNVHDSDRIRRWRRALSGVQIEPTPALAARKPKRAAEPDEALPWSVHEVRPTTTTVKKARPSMQDGGRRSRRRRLGIWTPDEYEAELRELGLPEKEISERKQKFCRCHDDARSFFEKELRFNLKDVAADAIRQRGGNSQRKRHRVEEVSTAHDSDEAAEFAMPMNVSGASGASGASGPSGPNGASKASEQKPESAGYQGHPERTEIVAKCKDPTVYNVDGKALPKDLVGYCLAMHMDADPKVREEAQLNLEGAMQCKRDGITDTEISTCIRRRKDELRLMMQLRSLVMESVEKQLRDSERREAEFMPPKQYQRWYSRVCSLVGKATKCVLTFGVDIGKWVVRDPRTAKIVFFILRCLLRDSCRYVYRTYVKDFQDADPSKLNFVQEKFAQFGIPADATLARFAVQEGVANLLQGKAFDAIYDRAFSIGKNAFVGMLKSIPLVGGAVGGAFDATLDVAQQVVKDSLQFYVEVALYKRDLGEAFSQLVELLTEMMPFKIERDEATGRNKLVRKSGTDETCGGLVLRATADIGAGLGTPPKKVGGALPPRY